MRRLTLLTFTFAEIAAPLSANAQIAVSTLVGVVAAELREVAAGLSAKRQVLGHPAYNDQGNPERIGKPDVAVPVAQLKEVGDKLILPGAPREARKATPAFDYAHETGAG